MSLKSRGAQGAQDPRRVFLLEDITAEDAALLERGLDAIIADAADEDSALPPTSGSLMLDEAMMASLKLAHEDEEFRKEVAKHIS
jgi:hypothetical protein